MPMYPFKKESNKNVVSELGLKTGNSLMRLKIAKYVIRHRMANYSCSEIDNTAAQFSSSRGNHN